MAEDLIRRKVRRLLSKKGNRKSVEDVLVKFGHELFATRREVRVLHRYIAYGAKRKRPWERVTSPARGKLVYAAYEYLQKHPKEDMNDVCTAVWEPLTGGYPNLEAFTTYCYSVASELINPKDLDD